MSDQEPTAPAVDRVECGAAMEPIVRLLIMTAMCLGFGLWCIYELYIGKRTAEADVGTYWFNVCCAVILTPLGLVLLVVTLIKARRRLVADVDGIGYVGKAKIAWGQVTKLVVRGKGLMDVCYDDDGAEDVLELDSYRLKSFDQLVKLIEAKTEGKSVEEA